MENVEKKEEIQVDETNKKVKNKTKKINWFFIVAFIVIAIFSGAIAPKTLQNDTFYTIKMGEYIANNGIGDLTHEYWTWHDIPNYTYPHWLYDYIIYNIYNLGGQLGIYISTIVLSIVMGESIFLLARKKSKNQFISAAISIAGMYLIADFIAARAQLVTFIIFIWTVFVIEKFLETKKLRYGLLLIIFPILITNLHCAVFPFYFVLFMPYIGEYFLAVILDLDIDLRIFRLCQRIKRKITKNEEKKKTCSSKIERIGVELLKKKERRPQLRKNPYKIAMTKNHAVILLIIIMAIAAFTGFLNPAGTGAYTYVYKTMQGNTMQSINEHLPMTLVENTPFAVAIIVFLMILIFTDTKIKLSDLFMLGGIVYLAFESRRQVSMFALFCMPILATLLSNLINKYDKDTFDGIEKFFADWFGGIVAICICILISVNCYIKPHMSENYIDTNSYPVEATTWLMNNVDVENMKIYNEYNYGSYLLFRGIKVFIDSRCDLYTPQFNGDYDRETKTYSGKDIFSAALDIAGVGLNYKDEFDRYGVTHVMLFSNNKLAMILMSDSNYKLLYDDQIFRIFEKVDANKGNEQSAVEANSVIENAVAEVEGSVSEAE